MKVKSYMYTHLVIRKLRYLDSLYKIPFGFGHVSMCLILPFSFPMYCMHPLHTTSEMLSV